MPLLRSSAASLLEQSLSDHLANVLTRQFQYDIGYLPNASEVRSWRNSLPVLSQDLRDAGLSNVEVLVEHQLPLSSKRADAVLCGVHPKTGRPSYVFVELKQWSHAHIDPEDLSLVYVDAYGQRPVLHPAEQVK
ncbi:MAG: ATP-binding protein, partial [Candidatus Nanopelagicales bacterium]